MHEITKHINSISNANNKANARIKVVQEWLLDDGYFEGKKYTEREMQELVNCTSAILDRLVEQAKIEILKANQLRTSDNDDPLSFSESQYISLIKSQRNVERLAGSQHQDLKDLILLIEQTKEDIQRLSGEKGKSTECSEARKQLTALIKQKTEIYKTVSKLEKDRNTSTKQILALEHKIKTDQRKLGDTGDKRLQIEFDL